MITTGIGFLAFIVVHRTGPVSGKSAFPSSSISSLPPILIIYGHHVFFTFGMWTITDEVKAVKTALVDNMVPAMVFLMCLSCNVKKFSNWDPKLLSPSAPPPSPSASASWRPSLFGGALGHPADAGAVCASWWAAFRTSSSNFLAVDDGIMSNIILMITINYSLLDYDSVAIGNFA